MCRPKSLTAPLLVLWVVFSLFYCNIFYLYHISDIVMDRPNFTMVHHVYNEYFNETGDFLLSTPGCTIPNYGRTIVYTPGKIYISTCERRGVFIDAVSDDEIVFTIRKEIFNIYRIKKKPYSCCYEIITRAISSKPGVNDTRVVHSACVPFDNGTKTKIIGEVISVKCSYMNQNNSYVFYRDSYIKIKKVKNVITDKNKEKWNVLILGIDTMSRARARHSLPLTTQYFEKTGWLDYKAYHKVGDNTYPNLMALLAGNAKLHCKKSSMDSCNNLLLWSKYKSAGYATAYGEDNLKLSDTFKNFGGFEVPPTDHYMRPFFLLGEYTAGNRICSQKMSSAIHILDYIHQFTIAYKHENFFGLFWINSYSHDPHYRPELADKYISIFLSKLSSTDTGRNTFIFFISNHGIRFGETRYSVESYYEERLPMFYIWVPHKFKKQYSREHYNMQLNQHRLVAPYDLHATLWDILKKSNTVTVNKSKVCPQCTSLFEEKSRQRTCADAAIPEEWCSCRKLLKIHNKLPEAQNVALTALLALRNITSRVKTQKCTRCLRLSLKYLMRVHSYHNYENNKTYYVVAFLTFPGASGYEVTVAKDLLGYKVQGFFKRITSYNTKGNCVVKRGDKRFCICEKITHCNTKVLGGPAGVRITRIFVSKATPSLVRTWMGHHKNLSSSSVLRKALISRRSRLSSLYGSRQDMSDAFRQPEKSDTRFGHLHTRNTTTTTVTHVSIYQ